MTSLQILDLEIRITQDRLEQLKTIRELYQNNQIEPSFEINLSKKGKNDIKNFLFPEHVLDKIFKAEDE